MTMKCEYCEISEGSEKAQLIYRDEDIVVAIRDVALIPGQVTIFPRQHFPILEMVPDRILSKCATIANKVGVVVFESFACQGTNVIVQNGLSAGQKIAHFALEVIPRREGDSLKLQWDPKQLMDDEMDTAFLMIKSEGDKLIDIGKEADKKEKVIAKELETTPKISSEKGAENQLIKSLRRRP